jgi:uncharacterized protein (TIGR00251 family)
MIIDVTAVPDSKKFSMTAKDGRLKISLKSAPEHNKANLELVKGLSKVLGCEVRLVAGQSSRRKKLDIAMSGEEWADFLSKLKE